MGKKKRHRHGQPGAGAPAQAPGVPAAGLTAPSWQEDVFAPVTLALCVLVFVYACVRAASLSIVHDEALTYFIQRTNSFRGILTYAHPLSPNSHFLNSLLIKVFTGLFGSSAFVVRMPAVLGCGLYLIGVYRIGRMFLTGPRLLFAAALLSLHPFLHDFFACARGYALALGFMSLGLYYLLRRIGEAGSRRDGRNAVCMGVFSALAVFSQLTSLILYFAFLCILVSLEAWDAFFAPGRQAGRAAGAGTFFKRMALAVVPGLLFLFLVYFHPVRAMLVDSEFKNIGVSDKNFAGESFWRDVVGSLTEVTAHNQAAFPQKLFFAFIVGIVAAGALFSLVLIVRRLRGGTLAVRERFFLCAGTLLFIYSVALVLQFVLMKVWYPKERWAIFYIPVFLWFVVFLAGQAWQSKNALVRWPLAGFLFLFSLALVAHFVMCLNVAYIYTWKYDAATHEMLKTVYELEKDGPLEDSSVRLENEWLFRPAIKFYILTEGLWWLDRDREPNRAPAGYYYFTDDQEDIARRGDLDIIKRFEVSKTWLGRPRPGSPNAPARSASAPGGIIHRESDEEKAKVFLDLIARDMNSSVLSYIGRGHLWASKERWEWAIGDYTRAIEIDPEAPEIYVAYLSRAMARVKLDAFEDAVADLNEVVRLRPDLSDGYDTRGFVFYLKKDYGPAVRDLDRAVALGPDKVSPYHHRALVYVVTGETERAIEDFGKVLALDPSNAIAAYNRGLLYFQAGRYDAAVADLTRVIQKDPRNGMACYYRGQAYQALGDAEGAAKDAQTARSLGVSQAAPAANVLEAASE